MSRIARKLQLLWRRLRWGFSERELWCLHTAQARWILPRLRKFKRIHLGYPAALAGRDEDMVEDWEAGTAKWEAVLDKMILAFEYIAKDDYELFKPWHIRPEVEEGLRLFHEHYFNLWD